jgi:AmmeMemoRadiSam system protein A
MPPPQPNSHAALDSSQPRNAEGDPAAACEVPGQRFPIQEFTGEERSSLLRLAHDSIICAIEGRAISLEAPTPHFAEHRGVFTSLYLRQGHIEKQLRGCVGYVLPACSVYRAVAETARAAAFEDNRFPPVTGEEAAHLEIELSILSPARPIQPSEIEIGRHGLLVSWRGRRGLLLPQVPVEHGWDRATFLEQTCRKALLPPDAWQKDATIEAFTAEIFGNKSGL